MAEHARPSTTETPQDPDDHGSDPDTPPVRLSRRRFLGTALGSAAALAACTGGESATTPSPTPVGSPSPSPTDPATTPGTGAGTGPGSGTGGGGGGGGGGTPTVATAPTETWNEPWVWRPSDWPGQALALNVVENQAPGVVVGFGNPSQVLFSYGGGTPGPTIRMRGDETLSLTLRNLLGLDGGTTYVGAYPDTADLTGYVKGELLTVEEVQKRAAKRGNRRGDFCLGEHTNGVHSVRTTNLHSHGLHVRPGRNPDGTHSDNVILRLIPQADLAAREADAGTGPIACDFLRAGDQIDFLASDDQVGQAHYEFRLGDVQGRADQPHPPGTHWYHPHAHGATHDQVASGMAGFLVVEGDVDDAIRAAMVPDRARDPGDPTRKTGPAHYRERLMLIQRVFNVPNDPDAPTDELRTPSKSVRAAADAVNGSAAPATIVMAPRATERWRVLNGSVDGKGFRRFMVLAGRYGVDGTGRLVHVDADGNPGERVTRGEAEAAKQDLVQLAMDGITLVTEDGRYRMKKLADQGDRDRPFPLADFPTAPPQQLVEDWAACFADGDELRNCYVRPNEVYLGPANRTDVFFTAPDVAPGDQPAEYTVIALGVILHADTPLQGLQQLVEPPAARDLEGTISPVQVGPPSGPGDVVIARLLVAGKRAEPIDPTTIELPEVPPYLRPIADDDPGLAAPGGGFRTRRVTYSGWGSQGLPLVSTTLPVDPDGTPTGEPPIDDGDPNAAALGRFVLGNPNLEGLRWVRRGTVEQGRAIFVLMSPNIRTMAIDGRKFDPTDPGRPRMHLDSAEEWVVCNDAEALWGDVDPEALPPAQFNAHYPGRALTLGEGMARWRDKKSVQVLTRAVDHPFHIHQNPFWVIRIDVPAADGTLHNILDAPRWMDAVPLPRHRGRVVFRARFPDFVGTYVNHCHILLHEDNGMMQVVEVTPFDANADDPEVARANYEVRDRLARGGTGADATDQVTALYGRATPDQAWVTNMTFVDPNHTTGQEYPGFDLTAPSE